MVRDAGWPLRCAGCPQLLLFQQEAAHVEQFQHSVEELLMGTDNAEIMKMFKGVLIHHQGLSEEEADAAVAHANDEGQEELISAFSRTVDALDHLAVNASTLIETCEEGRIELVGTTKIGTAVVAYVCGSKIARMVVQRPAYVIEYRDEDAEPIG